MPSHRAAQPSLDTEENGRPAALVCRAKAAATTGNNELVPRLADSAKWITACLGNDSFLRQQQVNEAKAVDLGLESSHTAQLLRELLAGKGNHWKGTCGDLLQALKSKSVELGIYGKLPESPRGLASRLRRDAPAIRKGWGVDVRFMTVHGRTMVVMEPLA